MGGFGIALELLLVGLLAVTLVHALRLQRALTHLREDRAALQDAVSGFDSGTRQAETGVAQLRETAERLGSQLHQAAALRDDLSYLSDRGETIADRLDAMVRTARGLKPSEPGTMVGPVPEVAPQGDSQVAEPRADVPAGRFRSQAERSLLLALQARR